MAVTIRRPERYIFGDVLKEGKWYWISDFEVNIKYEEQIFSTQSYQIFINNGTRVHEASNIDLSRMFSLISFERIERISERINVVDVLGVIVHVKHRQTFEAIERPYGVIPESRCIHFVLKDFNGRVLQCIAKDKVCKKFKKMWIRTELFSQVVCILRLWDISFFQGNFGLIGENDYSDILFDYPCPEVKMAKDRVASSNHFDEIRDGYLEHYKRINMY